MSRLTARRLRSLGGALLLSTVLGPVPIDAQTRSPTGSGWSRAAAAAYLDARQAWWRSWPNAARDHDTSCVSCHTSLPYALARPALGDALGEAGQPAPDQDLLRDVRERVRHWNEVDPYYPDQRLGLPKTSESRGTEAVLNALVLASRDARAGHLSDLTRTAFDHMWKLQFTHGEEAGGWAWLHFGLAPWESDGSEYFGAALAAVAVGLAPEGYVASPEIQGRLDSLRSYLRRGLDSRRPFDRVMLLWAGAELPDLVTQAERRTIARDAARLQNADGGWSLAALGGWERQDGTAPVRASDGYATGLVVFVLKRAVQDSPSGTVTRGLAWLERSQDPEGGQWPASSLNLDRDPTSDRGRFMSDAATAFAVLALATD